MKRFALALAAAILLGNFAGPALAQTAGTAGMSTNPMNQPHNDANNTSQQDSDRIYRETQSLHRTGPAKKMGPTQYQVIQDATAAAKSAQISCEVADAEWLGSGKVNVKGADVAATKYEVICGNGMGYLLTTQDPNPAAAHTCFEADASRAAAAAKGQQFADVCAQDVKAMGTEVLRKAGNTTCTVSNLQWYGQNIASKTEYSEVKCADGAGYMVVTGMPGNMSAPQVLGCADSAARGVKCAMTQVAGASGPAPASLTASYNDGKPTLDTFKLFIAGKNIKCAASNVRAIGKENKAKRHVVEFQCPEYPRGLVAFIPLDDSTAPFQSMDCDAAKKIGAICKYTTPN